MHPLDGIDKTKFNKEQVEVLERVAVLHELIGDWFGGQKYVNSWELMLWAYACKYWAEVTFEHVEENSVKEGVMLQ